MSTAYTSSIAARVLTDAGGPAHGRIQLFPMGEFSARDGRPGTLKGVKVNTWKLDAALAAALVARWQARETPLVVDYEHQTMHTAENGKPAPAAGWIESLEAGADGLYATVKWTDAARALIQADEYRYISPVFTFDPKTGAVLELKSAALTNYPALDGMAAVAARAEDDPPMKKETLEALRHFFGLAADADEAAVVAALKAQGDGQTLTAMLAVAKEADPDPAQYVPAAMLTAAQEKNAALAAKVKELEGSGTLAALTAEIDAALADGRLPKACEGWAKTTAKTNPEAIKSYIASAVPVAALKGTQTGGTSPSGAPVAALTDEELYACNQLGLSSADFIAAKSKEGK